MSNQKQAIYELLPEVQRAVGAIGKDKVNCHQDYNFRGIDDVLNAIGPELARFGVLCTAEVLSHERTETETGKGYRVGVVLFLRVRFHGPDGSYVENVTVGEAQDYNGDKATNKAMSVAFKYAAFMGLAIPVAPGTLDDSDHDAKEDGGKPTVPPSKRASGSSSKPAATGGKVKKSPPNEFDGKPAHDMQLKEIAAAMMAVTGEDEPKHPANQEKLRGLLDYVNGQRPGSGIEGSAGKLKDLFYVEAEKVMKVLAPQLAKVKAVSTK